MNDAASSWQGSPVTDYLQQMQVMSAELETAMRAVAANSLSELEASVARQEMIAAGLRTTAGNAADDLRLGAEAPLRTATRHAAARLQSLNLQYAALLRRSGSSIAVLSALCRGQQGQMMEVRGTGMRRQTWSCEM
jgi:hypothetical protein